MLNKRKQCPIRLWEDDYNKVKAKIVQDKLTFQKLAEVLFKAYLDGNKEILKLVEKYSDQKSEKRRRYNQFTDFEADKILRIIEGEISPLADELEDRVNENK
jgi:hypothetical protein